MASSVCTRRQSCRAKDVQYLGDRHYPERSHLGRTDQRRSYEVPSCTVSNMICGVFNVSVPRSCVDYRELKVDDAETSMIATLRWREEFKITELLNEQFPEEIFGGVGRVFGHDKEGRPVTYVIYLVLAFAVHPADIQVQSVWRRSRHEGRL